MNSMQLQCFTEAASRLSFSQAAEAMHVSQPTISHQVKTLEAELGCTLLTRSTRTVRLTDEGFIFLPYAREIMELEARVKEQLKSNISYNMNTLRIGVRDGFEAKTAAPMLRALNSEFANFRPVIRQAPHAALRDMLETNVIDVMFSYRDASEDLAGATQLHVLGEVPLCCVCAPEHHLACYEGESITADELKGESPVIVAGPMHTIPAVAYVQSELTHTYTQEQVIMGSDIEVTLSLVAAGLGFTLMLDIPGMRRDDLVYIRCEGIGPVTCYVRTRRGRQNKLVTRYIELVKESMAWEADR